MKKIFKLVENCFALIITTLIFGTFFILLKAVALNTRMIFEIQPYVLSAIGLLIFVIADTIHLKRKKK